MPTVYATRISVRAQLTSVFMVGAVWLALSPGVYFTTDPAKLEDQVFVVASGLLGLVLATYNLLIRLTVTPNWLCVWVGPWRREVDLTTLREIGWRTRRAYQKTGVHYVPQYVLTDGQGRVLRFDVNQFYRRSDEWG